MMVFKKVFFVVGLLLGGIQSFSQDSGDHLNVAMERISERGEVYFSFPIPEPDLLRHLLLELSLDKIGNDSVYVYANRRGFQWFLDNGPDYTVLPAPGLADFGLNMRSVGDLSPKDLQEDWDFYPTYEAYTGLMRQFEIDFPDLCEVHSIGQTTMGRELLFARVFARGEAVGPVPRLMYTSTIHGDEPAGFVLSLRLIHHLLSEYGRNEAITELLREVDIWICPNENPDGTYRNDNSTIYGATRGNVNGVDLNRNYPNPVRDPSDSMQAETSAMIQFVDTMGFSLSANMHGGVELVNYPFDSWMSFQNRHADHAWWQFVMQEYVDTVHAYAPGGYMTGLGTGITHGGDWYVVYGSRQDYLNYYLSCREFTLELSDEKMLPPSKLPQLWENNHRSLLNYIRQSTYGVAGVVAEASTGKALDAVVHIPGHDKDNSEVSTRMPVGFFQRPLVEGPYDLVVRSEGFPDQLYPELQVRNYETLWLTVQMGMASFEPSLLAFEPTLVNRSSYKELGIHNPGTETLHFSLDNLSGDGAFGYAVPAKAYSFSLLPGNSHRIPFSFGPAEPGFHEATARFRLDADPETCILIPLRAQAVENAALLHPSADLIDFGEVIVGESAIRSLHLKNAGDISLVIDSVSLPEAAFSVHGGFPIHLRPDDLVELELEFQPRADTSYQAELFFVSDAYNNEDLSVSLRGTGTGTTPVVPVSLTGLRASVYPNPLTPHSVIGIELPEGGAVTAQLFDMQGRLIRIVLDAILEAGMHQLALLEEGSSLMPGIYLLRVSNRHAVLTLRVLKKS
ncbi:MAG: M14 family zinc carboxypeptidase [Bacteroidales bacterium]